MQTIEFRKTFPYTKNEIKDTKKIFYNSYQIKNRIKYNKESYQKFRNICSA